MNIRNNRKGTVFLVSLAMVIVAAALGSWLILGTDKYKPAPKLPNPPLKELAKNHNLQIGVFIAYNYVTDRPYREIAESQFEFAIVDGQPNWVFEDGALRPGPGDFDFSRLDTMVKFAEERHMPVRIQHYVWGEEKWLPKWLKDGNFSKEVLLGLLENHIRTVGTRYKGRVREYTVVNEAFSRKLRANGLNEWWGDRLGYEYIDKSFQWARETDPNAILILNDFGNEVQNANSDEMYNYVKEAKKRGVPIDAIGMQMHLDANKPPDKEAVKSNMRRFADLGLKVYVTEFDVHLHDLPEPREKEYEIQAKVYKDMLEACKEVGPNVCPSFGLLGLTDQQTWYKGLGLKGSMPLSFDDNYNPKPAFFALREALLR